MYPLQFLAVTNKDITRLQTAMNPAFRKMSRNMASFPTDLLLLPRKFGGLGFPDMLRLVPAAKLAVLTRVGARPDSEEVISSILHRRARSLGFDPSPGIRFSFNMLLDNRVAWVDSIIEFAQEFGGALSWGGRGTFQGS